MGNRLATHGRRKEYVTISSGGGGRAGNAVLANPPG